MYPFETLSEKENEDLLKFPAFISLLAANRDGKLDEDEKQTAIKFSHIATFSCDSLMCDYFILADKNFEKNLVLIERNLPKEKDEKDIVLKNELSNLKKIVMKLGKDHATIFTNSMQSFREHVSKAHQNMLVNFIFPLPIQGLSD